MSDQKWDVREEHTSTDTPLIFQTLDWYCQDILNENTEFYEYNVFVFGITLDSKPITVCLKDFYPFFFIEVPHGWDQSCIYTVREVFGKNIKNIEFLKRKRYHGFENNKIRNFLKLSFWNFRSFKNMRYRIENNVFNISGKDYRFEMYESNIDPILRLTHLRDILTAGWIKITNYTFEEMYQCKWTAVENYPEAGHQMANFRTMFFDIEACSEDGSFPNALKKNDRVTQICCINKDKFGTQKYLFNLGTIDAVEDTTVIQCASEKKLLVQFARFVIDTNPDIIVGYNILGFDIPYMIARATRSLIIYDFDKQGFYKDRM